MILAEPYFSVVSLVLAIRGQPKQVTMIAVGDALFYFMWIAVCAPQAAARSNAFGRVRYIGDERFVERIPTGWKTYPSKATGRNAFGNVKYVGDERIVGGITTEPNKYPFMIYLQLKESNGNISSCGASLLNSLYIITAAHCIKRMNGEEIKSMVALLGHHHLRTRDERWSQVFRVEKWFYNKFDHKSMNNDVAILQLQTPVEFTKGVQPLCLPPAGAYKSTTGLVRAIGWGAINGETLQMSDYLREADLEVLSDSYCQNIYKKRFRAETMFCAGLLDGSKDTCLGDSGGPVFVHDDKKVPVLVGLTSFANKGCGRPGLLAAYTRIPTFTKWIVSKTARGGPICFGTFKK